MTTTTQSNEKAEPVVLPADLRDYFAAKAMVGIYQMIATGSHGVNANDIEGGIADQAYLMADAMLRARQQ